MQYQLLCTFYASQAQFVRLEHRVTIIILWWQHRTDPQDKNNNMKTVFICL